MRERVALRFRGLMLERLIDRATSRGVTFSRVKRLKGREAKLITDRRGADELMKLAREFKLDVSITSVSGPGAVLRRVRERWTLPVAVLLVGALALSMLARVWVVDINMLDGADSSAIRAALDDMGIVAGARLTDADMERVQSGIVKRLENYAYIGARLQGVRLLIEATETFPAPDVYDYSAQKDIVAVRDARIVKIDVLAGTACVSPGDYVRKGDALIIGSERDGRETTRGVNAMGSVTGRAWLRGEASDSLTDLAVNDTGRKRDESEVRLWDFSWPIKTVKSYENERVEEAFYPIAGIIVPLGVLKRTHYETVQTVVARDLDALKEKTSNQAVEMALQDAPKDCEIVQNWIDFTVIDNETLISRAVVEIETEIAAPVR